MCPKVFVLDIGGARLISPTMSEFPPLIALNDLIIFDDTNQEMSNPC